MAPKTKAKAAAPKAKATAPVKLAPIKAAISDPLSKVLKVANNPKGGVQLTLSLPTWLSPGDILAIVSAIANVLQKWITQLISKPAA